MKKINLSYRISLAETDSVGVVYFAKYLMFFEKGHQEFLRQAGINNAELIKNGIYLPIREANCEYYSPIFYDDLISIETVLKNIKKNLIEFNYDIINTNTNKVAASGFTRHLFADSDFRIINIPTQILLALKNVI